MAILNNAIICSCNNGTIWIKCLNKFINNGKINCSPNGNINILPNTNIWCINNKSYYPKLKNIKKINLTIHKHNGYYNQYTKMGNVLDDFIIFKMKQIGKGDNSHNNKNDNINNIKIWSNKKKI